MRRRRCGGRVDPLLNPISGRSGADTMRPKFWDPLVQAAFNAEAWDDTSRIWSRSEDLSGPVGFRFTVRSIRSCRPMRNHDTASTSDLRRSSQIVSAGSRHQGGCHVLMGDGAVTFITDAIDSGDSSQETVWRGATNVNSQPGSQSPYGVWGAMGTRASKEVIGTDAFN